MHHIQRKILNQLMYAATLGYAQMRPTGVESNHFAYHLEQLVREGLVGKEERNYFLTPRGLALVDRVSHGTMTVRLQPHIVTSLHVTNDAGQSLLYRHEFQPYLGLYGPPQGRLHYDENVAEAAVRELAEKTGLTDVQLAHRGMAYVHTTKAGEDISKLLMHVFTGAVQGAPELLAPTKNGACAWMDTDKLGAAECMPGYKEIRKLLSDTSGDLFFVELETELADAKS